MKLKSLSLTIALSMSSLLGNAANESTMIITQTNGSTASIILADNMRGCIDLRNDVYTFIVMDSYDEEVPELFSITIPKLYDIKFENVWASIDSTLENNTLSVNLADGKLYISNVTDSIRLDICTIDGIVEERTEIKNDCEWSLAQYGAGLHIVKVGTQTFKIRIK